MHVVDLDGSEPHRAPLLPWCVASAAVYSAVEKQVDPA
jgi:hypothetical protein